MKKGWIWGLLAGAVVVLGIVVSFFQAAGSLCSRNCAASPPLTQGELDQLKERLDAFVPLQAAPETKTTSIAKRPVSSRERKTAAPAESKRSLPEKSFSREAPAGPLPTCLTRALTLDELSHVRELSRPKERFESWVRFHELRIEAGIQALFGRPPLNGIHTASALGFEELCLGHWGDARRYLWTAVRDYESTNADLCRFTLGVLAWLERDPEEAAYLLQLSCEGSFERSGIKWQNLIAAYKLCRRTGSDELATHYLCRALEEFPEYTERLAERGMLELAPPKSLQSKET